MTRRSILAGDPLGRFCVRVAGPDELNTALVGQFRVIPSVMTPETSNADRGHTYFSITRHFF